MEDCGDGWRDECMSGSKMASEARVGLTIFDNTTGQSLAWVDSKTYTLTDRWFVWENYCTGQDYAYDLDKLVAFQRVIVSLSDRKIWSTISNLSFKLPLPQQKI